MITRERFEQGLTVPQYLDQMGTNKETFPEKAMLEVRKKLRAEHLAPWRQAVVDEVRQLLKV
jgi:hypothetical protein